MRQACGVGVAEAWRPCIRGFGLGGGTPRVRFVRRFLGRRGASSAKPARGPASEAVWTERERERARLARELHDGLGGSLSALVLQSERVLRRMGDGPGRPEMEVLRAMAEEALQDLRRSMRLMRREFDLHAALRSRVAGVDGAGGADAGPAARIAIRGRIRRLPSDMQLSLYRAAQEALTNVERHARARRVDVALTYGGDVVRLSVEDDGVGFRPSAPSGLGLSNLAARAAHHEGRLRVRSVPGRGTRIDIVLPIPPEGSHLHALPGGSPAGPSPGRRSTESSGRSQGGASSTNT